MIGPKGCQRVIVKIIPCNNLKTAGHHEPGGESAAARKKIHDA